MDKLTATLSAVGTLSATLSSEIYIKMQDKTVAPTEETQTIVADDGYNGLSQVTVNAIPNQYVDTSDADATAQDILQDKTAYVNGEKVTGTFVFDKTKYGISIDDVFGDVTNGTLNKPTGNINLTISGFRSIATYGLYNQFVRNTAIKSVNFADLESVSTTYAMQYCFNACSGLNTVSFPKLTTLAGEQPMSYCFYGCTGLRTADFSKLTTLGGTSTLQYLFYGCTNLTSVDFSSLKTIGSPTGAAAAIRQLYYAFYNCNNLTTISFPSLEAIYCNGNAATYGAFSYNNKVQKFYFPKLTTMTWSSGYTNSNRALPIQNMFSNCTALTEIHFGADNRSAIEATTGYATKWGAPSNCQILFDL